MIGLSITFTIFIVIVDELIIVEFDLNQVSTLNGASKYLYTEEGKLLNNYRGEAVFPNDKLTYKTNVISKLNESVQVLPTIQIIRGGQNTTDPIKLDVIDFSKADEKVSISGEFFIKEQGHNEIVIEYRILNASDGKQVDLNRINDEVQVIS